VKLLITGSAGLIGSESARYFFQKGYRIVGIDNDMRAKFFGAEASTKWNLYKLCDELGSGYIHHDIDIRNANALEEVYKQFAKDFKAIIHTAAQPSHDWAASDAHTDFSINAQGTLNLLFLARKYCPEVPFIFTSTNKVYGDTPNFLPLVETEKRWEIAETHTYYNGIDETMSIDQTKHSLFGASKVAADVLTQEYGRYFNMPTACFRGGCLTGPNHSGTMLHGFLSYLMKCAVTGDEYTVFGYKGKQVRDNIHSYDLVRMFEEFIGRPTCGEVYNAGGSRFSNCSVIEAIEMCELIAGQKMKIRYSANNRVGDHIWYISSVQKFKKHYPQWQFTHTVADILCEIFDANKDRWANAEALCYQPN
jgi:CDP-paratose 2-epimerase